MTAAGLGAGARVRSGDHAENDPLIVPGAEITGVGVNLLAAHTGERSLFRSGKQTHRAMNVVNVVRTG